MSTFDASWSREQFPGLKRMCAGRPAVFFDGPAGSQIPQCVVDAVVEYLVETNANHEGLFATARESDALLHEAHRAVADFLGADDPDCTVFGANMTSLTFALSRSLGRTWGKGDEVIVSHLDHDANFTPWVLAAGDAGASVHRVGIDKTDCTLDLEDLRSKLSERTKLVAVCCASNAVGTIPPFREIVRMAHEVGALVFLDAVHYAPHARMAVDDWGCDFAACSAYKFFGPHVGILWGKRELLEQLPAYKVRPASNALPERWMTGTQNHEGIAGTLACVEYLAALGKTVAPDVADRRGALDAAYAAIGTYERELAAHFVAAVRDIKGIKLWGITDPARFSDRAPTFSITHERRSPSEIASILGEQGIFVWNGNYYALPLTEVLGVEPEGMVRIGFLHYNTIEEVDRLVEALRNL